MDSPPYRPISGVYDGACVRLSDEPEWPQGTAVVVTPVFAAQPIGKVNGHVIIAGFGLAGRCVADLLDCAKAPYTIIEQNPLTVRTQQALGRRIIAGDVAEAATLLQADLPHASILALTIPNDEGVLQATSLARRLNPDVYIIARTQYSSKGMQASRLGADDVVKAEQAVALQFYEKLRERLGQYLNTEPDQPAASAAATQPE